MKLLPSTLGADRKKILLLSGLLAVLVGLLLYNQIPGGSVAPEAASAGGPRNAQPATATAPAPAPSSSARPTAASLTPMPPQRAAQARRGEASVQDVRISMKPPEGIDLSRIDPTIRLDLLARLQKMPLEGGSRNLFDFGAAPAPPKPPPDVAPIKPGPGASGSASAPDAPAAVAAAPPKPEGPPPPPPIPLKFYGFVNGAQGGSRAAFFLEGEDIFVAGENDVVHNRYKIIRIGVNSAVVEDTTNKHQQTLPLVEELKG